MSSIEPVATVNAMRLSASRPPRLLVSGSAARRSRRAVLLLSTLLACGTGAAGAQAATWTAGPSFAPGTFSGVGGAATDGTGVSTVVWAQDSGDGSAVFAQRISPNGSRGPELRVGTGAGATVAATSSGAVVAWTLTTGSHDVRVARIGAGGTVDSPVTVASGGSLTMPPVVASRPNGDLAVAWVAPVDLDADGHEDDNQGQLHVRRVAADQTRGPDVDLGLASYGLSLRNVVSAAITADGRARLAWSTVNAAGTASEVRVARLTGTGALDTVSSVSASPYSTMPDVAANGANAVVTWWEGDDPALAFLRLQAARLPATGVIARTPTTIGSGISSAGAPSKAVAVAPDGAATIAYPRGSTTLNTSASVFVRRLAADDTLTPETLLSATPKANVRASTPALAPAAGGELMAVWSQLDTTTPGNSSFQVVGRSITADGTPGGDTTNVPGGADAFMLPPVVAGDGAGNGIALWAGFGGTNSLGYRTAQFDAVLPAVDASIPASVERGVEATFSVKASARTGISGVAWQFGDGGTSLGTSVNHTYGRTGSYPVTVTVTDFTGARTVVSRTVEVTEPGSGTPGGGSTPPGGGGSTPGGGGNAPGGGGAAGSGSGAETRAAALLKLTKVTRKGSKLTVAGTIDRRAGGRVSLTWTQKVGRKTLRQTATAKIAKGKFSATLKLTKKLAKAKTSGKLTVAYAGDASLRAASATKAVKAPKKQ